MERFEVIQNAWLSQELVAVPSVSEVKGLMKSHVDKKKRNFYLTMGVIAVSFLVILVITLFGQPKLVSTLIGELLILATILYGGFLKVRTYEKKNEHSDSALDVSQFLDNLRKEKVDSCTGTANQQLTVFSLLSIGYFFFMYEELSASVTRLMIGYGVAVAYLALAWFVYRPYMIKRKQAQVKSLLTKIESIKKEIS
ncbi:MAG: hypothetical protein RIA63_05510 [Cyclobacteriaceae bacterium]